MVSNNMSVRESMSNNRPCTAVEAEIETRAKVDKMALMLYI